MKKVLIVEDEASLQKALLSKLEKGGYEVLQAFDGEEGLKMALAEKPDLILLDIIMPKMDGVTMLNKIREDEWGRNAKVIILTNLSEGNQVVAALDKGVHDYLVKADWRIEEVMEKIEDKLEE